MHDREPEGGVASGVPGLDRHDLTARARADQKMPCQDGPEADIRAGCNPLAERGEIKDLADVPAPAETTEDAVVHERPDTPDKRSRMWFSQHVLQICLRKNSALLAREPLQESGIHDSIHAAI